MDSTNSPQVDSIDSPQKNSTPQNNLEPQPKNKKLNLIISIIALVIIITVGVFYLWPETYR